MNLDELMPDEIVTNIGNDGKAGVRHYGLPVEKYDHGDSTMLFDVLREAEVIPGDSLFKGRYFCDANGEFHPSYEKACKLGGEVKLIIKVSSYDYEITEDEIFPVPPVLRDKFKEKVGKK